jgi:exopolysaccharide biosynthesis polyprenyl glycosylphosphotransferase
MHSTVGVSKAEVGSAKHLAVMDAEVGQPLERRKKAANFRRAIVAGEIAADLLTITSAVLVGYATYDSLHIGKHIFYPARTVVAIAFAFAVIMVLMLDRVGAYRGGNSLLRVRETEQVLRVSAEAFLIALAASFFASILFSRWLLILCLGMVPLFLFLEKHLTYLLVHSLHSKGYGNENVLIYGSGCTGRRVFSVLQRSPKLGLEPLVFVDDDPEKAGTMVYELAYERRRSAPVVKGPVTRELIANYGADLVIVAIPSIGRDKFARTIDESFGANAKVSFVPSHLLASDPWVDYQDIDGVLLASFGKAGRRTWYEGAKRVTDFLLSLLLLIVGSPLWLVLALAIKLDSRGSVLFRQERVGHNGRLFTMYKFRTMHAMSQSYDYSPRASSDPRITSLGRLLRRTSLDEVPQLLNVLRGNMSLVGPRPEMPFIVEQYNERHRRRLQVKPGLTGLWQLSGDRAFLIHENVEYDIYYIQNRNFFMDMAILLHTVAFAARGI